MDKNLVGRNARTRNSQLRNLFLFRQTISGKICDMCGRFACSLNNTALQERVRREAIDPKNGWKDQDFYSPSYNVAPRRWIPVIRYSQDNYLLQTMVRYYK